MWSQEVPFPIAHWGSRPHKILNSSRNNLGKYLFYTSQLHSLNKPNHLSSHDRKLFQVDRIAFYSDAIFAIASTLLILEFKIPPLGKDRSWAEILEQYQGKLYIPVLGLIISFYSISLNWIKHHALFEKISGYTHRLLIINQVFLFLNMILPVSTSFMLDNNPMSLRLFLYFSNIGLCNFVFYLLLVTALRPANGLSRIHAAEYHQIREKDRSLYRGIALTAAGILAIFTLQYFYLAFFPFVLIRIYRHLSRWFGKSSK